MTIRVACPHCQALFAAKDEKAGKRGKCPKCQGVLQVPSAPVPETPPSVTKASSSAEAAGASIGPVPSPKTPSPVHPRPAAARTAKPAARPGQAAAPRHQDPAELGRKILAAFQGAIEPVRTPITYHFGIFLVAVVMVVLPVAYVALIGLVGWLLYLHAVHNTFLLTVSTGGRGRVAAAFFYVGPLVAGAILILFMIKPLFARPARSPSRRSLSREQEPLLFAFVERVCMAVGAPMPKRIDVDCQVNASASFRRGWGSLLLGNDLVLTIGLPLVAGLNLRQFAGVLAHEFGHFTQGAGMRMTYIIRSISFWFTRVVYERDEWDQRLVQWSESIDNRIAIFLYLARLFVWLTRRILWVLMMVGHAVAGYMLRQMEFDADRYEARLAGSDTFEQTCRRLVVLNVARQGAETDLGEFFKEGRLGDNLPKLILHNVGQIPAEVMKRINEVIDQSTTGLLDTHPADKDRIANARRENAAGIFRLEQPASVLFADFAGLSVNVTRDFYRAIFGPHFSNVQVLPVESLLARQSKEQEADKALRRYFQNQFSLLRPLILPGTWIVAPTNPRSTAERLKAARQRMLAKLNDYARPFTDYQKADDLLLEVEGADALLRAGLRVSKEGLSVAMSDCIEVNRVRNKALDTQRQAESSLGEFERAAGERLYAALELLHVPQVAARLEHAAAWQEDAKKILAALALLIREVPSLVELRKAHVRLVAMASNLEKHRQDESLISALRKQMEETYGQIVALHRELGTVRYPFDHAKGSISLAEYVLETLPSTEDLGGIYESSREILATAHNLYFRLVARLVVMAEKIESLLGLEPLPDPPQEPAAQSE